MRNEERNETGGRTDMARRESSNRSPARWESERGLSQRDPWGGWFGQEPFRSMHRMMDDMERAFFGGGSFLPSRWSHQSRALSSEWMPQIESFQKGDQFVVRADLPGLKKEDVNVEVTDDQITIEGERRDEHTEEREGYYSSERSYGKFCRTIPLPLGALADSAKATFNNGVLEVTLNTPPHEVSRGRKIEISGATSDTEAKPKVTK